MGNEIKTLTMTIIEILSPGGRPEKFGSSGTLKLVFKAAADDSDFEGEWDCVTYSPECFDAIIPGEDITGDFCDTIVLGKPMLKLIKLEGDEATTRAGKPRSGTWGAEKAVDTILRMYEDGLIKDDDPLIERAKEWCGEQL